MFEAVWLGFYFVFGILDIYFLGLGQPDTTPDISF